MQLENASLKTTIELPDALLRDAKIAAARKQATLRELLTHALEAALERDGAPNRQTPAWRRSFGTLRHLRADAARVNAAVEATFEKVDAEAWK
jgi:hypothetical protein